MIKYDKSQQIVLEEFFNEETTWFPTHVMNKFLSALMIIISSVFMIMPHTIWDMENDKQIIIMVYILYTSGIWIYGDMYYRYNESEKVKKLYKVIRWMPVDAFQFKLYRTKKCAKLCVKYTVAFIIIRVFIDAAIMHKFSIFDLIIPVMFNLLVPVIICSVPVLLKRDKS